MAAGNKIAGLTIEIAGNTTALTKSLTGVNKQSRDLQAELKQVDRLLKLDPSNVTLIAQKQKLLAESVSTTKDKLDKLKEAEKQAQAQFAKGDIGEEQYRAIQREVIKTEQELGKLETSLGSTNKKWKELGASLDSAGTKMKNIGGTMTTRVTAPIIAGTVAAVEGTRELRTDLAKLETNAQQAGANIDITNNALRDLNAITGETDSNIEALSNLMQAGFTDNNLTSAVDALSGAVIKFPDTLKIEGLSDGLQETLATGAAIGPFSELLERMGVDLEVFNEGLAAASASGQEHNYVLQELTKLGLADVNAAYRENNKELIDNANAQNDLKMATAELGETLEPILTKVTTVTTEMLELFNSLSPETQKIIGLIAGVVVVLGPLLMIIGQIATGISALIGFFGAGGAAAGVLGTAFTLITGPIGIAVAAIAAIIGIGVLLYKNWDAIKEKGAELWEGLKSIWSGITDTIKSAIEKIKSFFKFEWDFPKIKLPHFDIKGKFSLSPPSIPSFGVKWYKEGGIFNSPSVVGVGDVPEAVLPINKIDSIIAKALEKANVNTAQQSGVILQVGTLIADDYGLKLLERKLKSMRIIETTRVGGMA